MRPLTPVRRARWPVQLPDGTLVPDAGVWRLSKRHQGASGDLMIHRPGGWRSVVALGRLIAAVRP